MSPPDIFIVKLIFSVAINRS